MTVGELVKKLKEMPQDKSIHVVLTEDEEMDEYETNILSVRNTEKSVGILV